MTDWKILNNVTISGGKVIVNGKTEHSLDDNFVGFSKELFNEYSKGYSKFFKMDKLSKLAFISSEILLKGHTIPEDKKNEVALIIGNSAATTPTDTKYFDSMTKIPSPAVFVYTLPNILIGEICIRNKFYGENLFFVSENFNCDELLLHIETLINSTNTQYIIAGWVNYENDEEYLANIYLISQSKSYISLSKKNLENNLKLL
ncbi:MAG: hypothetical protein R6U11_01075 [Bacteroidales bacterium]